MDTQDNDPVIELPDAIVAELESFARIFDAAGSEADCRGLLRRAATALSRILDVNKTVRPETHTVAFQAVVDRLARWAVIAGIAEDDAQAIIADGFRQGAAGDGIADATLDIAERTAQGAPANGGSDRRTIKIVGGKLPRIVDEAEAALMAGAPDFYRFGDALVRPVVEEVPASDMTRTKIHRLVPITKPHLVDVLTAVARWQKFDRRSKTWVSVNCPDQVAEVYLAREGRWRLPPLVGVINTPMLRADYSLLDRPGYDVRTALLYRPNGTTFEAVPDRPSREDADRALRRIEDLVSTFPFVSGADGPDRSVAVSAILSALDRRAVPTAPAHGFSAPVAGSGKSMLVDLASVIVTGQRAPVIDQSKEDAETDKRLIAALLRGGAIVSFDNVDRPLDSALFCQALTTVGTMQLRVLGYSRDVVVPNSAMFFITGNHLTLAGDLTRRALICRLDPGCERPELRQFTSDAVAMAKEHRAELEHVSAGLNRGIPRKL